MFRYFLFILVLLPASKMEGQVTFKKRFGSSALDLAWCVEVLPDNSFIVGGSSIGGGFGSGDAMLVKFSATGDVVWSRLYGSAGNENFWRILSCSDGNFLAMGQTNGFGAGGVDIYLVKFDLNGNVLWERTCGGGSPDVPRGIIEVSDGYVVTGTVQGFGNGIIDAFAEKLDFNGNSVWSKAYGTSGQENGGDAWEAPNGQIWICGSVFVGSLLDGTLQRIGANGAVIDTKRFGTAAENEILYNLTSGGPGVVGSGSAWINGQVHPGLFGFNSSGGLIWAKRYLMPGGNNYDFNAENCPNGGLVVAPYPYNSSESLGYLVKLDDSGNVSWAKAHPFGTNGRLTHVRPAPDGGYVAVGQCTGAGQDIFILKTDAAGNVEGCCPEDASVTVVDLSLSVTNLSYTGVDGPATIAATADNQDISLDETDLCNGPSCCPTEAGTMLPQTLHACINQPATLTHNGDEVLDNDDLLQFILFSDPNDTLGSIIVISNTPTFTFDPATMQTGVTYYVAAIAGNNVGGNVDLNDPCFDLSDNAAELIWHPLPEVELQTDNSDVCPGDCRTLTAVLTGTPPFTLTVTSPAGTTTVTFQNNTGTFQICLPPGAPPGSFTVQATALTDAWCACP
ncbi:MAG: hypothetical protein JNJ90_16700 [Saprospiraceae bacterium]|nr:hypothetical protein [Saprospiraceae bacterium]